MQHPRNRSLTFSVSHNTLIRIVRLSDGQQYEHRCDLESFQAVVLALAEQGLGTMDGIRKLTDLPFTRINVALEFLKDRGCVQVFGRKSYPASDALFEDAMTEWHTLAEKRPR
jgi:hypothetical protein